MKGISTGNIYRLYDDSMEVFKRLPAQAYSVCFSKNSGFFLEKHSDIEIKEKVYGVHLSKVQKIMRGFERSERNFGVILSGDKGIGKSLTAKVIAKTAIESGYPLIIVNEYVPGIADFINSIEQEVVVLFDEFDKTFAEHGEMSPQAEMLTLFDGLSMGKKLFVITCNELRGLNQFLVNRPGRFHYHLRFEYPSSEEIREYLTDKLPEKFWGEIDKVISFAKKINLNYDCLRAIAFELETGESFEDSIKDLNIMHLQSEYYDIELVFSDGTRLVESRNLDMFEDRITHCTFEDPMSRADIVNISFNPKDAVYDSHSDCFIIELDKIIYEISEYYKNDDEDTNPGIYSRYFNKEPKWLRIHKKKFNNLHYTL